MMQTMPTMPQTDMPAPPAATGAAPSPPQGDGFGQVLQQTHQQAQQPATAAAAPAEATVVETPAVTLEATGGDATLAESDLLADLETLLTPEKLQQTKDAILRKDQPLDDAVLPDAETQAAASALMVQAPQQPVAQTVQQLVDSLPDDLEGLEAMTKEALQSLRGQLRQATAENPVQVIDAKTTVKGESGFGQMVQQLSDEVTQPVAEAVQQTLLPGQPKPEVDQRFARLLNPKAQPTEVSQPSLRQQQTQVTLPAEGMTAVETPELAVQAKAEVTAFAESLGRPVEPTGIHLQSMQGAQAPAVTPFQAQPVLQTMDAQPVVQLPSGQQVAETVVVDQVVAQLRGSVDGETGQMILRLKPAELGELRLDLMMESDKVKASIQAQSQQVQEVIERHLPRLRDALEQQGLRVDDFKVTVDAGQDEGRHHQAFGQDQQSANQGYPAQSQDALNPWEEVPISVVNPSMMTAGGLSLHV